MRCCGDGGEEGLTWLKESGKPRGADTTGAGLCRMCRSDERGVEMQKDKGRWGNSVCKGRRWGQAGRVQETLRQPATLEC